MAKIFQRAYPPATAPEYPAIWLPVQKDQLVIQTQGDDARTVALLRGDATLLKTIEHKEEIYLGLLDQEPCITTILAPDAILPAGWTTVGLRHLYGRIPDIEYELVGYALQIAKWHQTSHFCPVCATPMESIKGNWGRICPNCHYHMYPPVIPAMIVLVHDGGERLLLAHKPGWGKRYGLFAGFVEPSETLEECVQRELLEEAGIEVTDVTYVKSQAWPFPNQLMIGFQARYVAGDPRPQDNELDSIAWFSRHALPEEIPPPPSVAYQLIADWLNKQAAAVIEEQKEPESKH